MDAELEFAIQETTTGKQLFDQVLVDGCSSMSMCYIVLFVYARIYDDKLPYSQIVFNTSTGLAYHNHSLICN